MPEPETNPTTTGAATATAAPHAPAVDPILAEYHATKARLAVLEDAERQRAAAAAEAERQKIADKDALAKHYQGLLEAQSNRVKEVEAKALRAERDRSLMAALSEPKDMAYSNRAVPQQLMALWRDDFETVELPTGELHVREKLTLRPAAQVVAERLKSPDYSHCLAPTSRGGGGTQLPGAAPTAGLPAAAAAPKSLGHEAMEAYRARNAARFAAKN